MKKLCAILIGVLIFTGCEKKEQEVETYYYDFDYPTFRSTTDYTKVKNSDGESSNVFIRMDKNNALSICGLKDNKAECFTNDYNKEKDHFIEVFGEASCIFNDYQVRCGDGKLNCHIYSNGEISCSDITTNHVCRMSINSDVECQ